ncbi:helix-turn-helix domain-containing protein [Aquabacterium sp.]|uniref:helix-turn-helix domain-containing protein n=1 Tax=Aquabacterium sp. TaxID=1872578 RepID=UPI0035B3F53B
MYPTEVEGHVSPRDLGGSGGGFACVLVAQEGLAELADLHRTYVGSVKRGERNIAVDNMEALVNGLGLDICELLRLPTTQARSGA